MLEKLKILGYKTELDELKRKCNELNISYLENGEDLKELIDIYKQKLKDYRDEITNFIKQESKNIDNLKNRAKLLKIDFKYDIKASDLKKSLRLFRDKIKEFVSSVKYKSELSKLKSKCEHLNILVPKDLSDKALEQHLYNKLLEDQSDEAKQFVNNSKELKRKIINEAESNPYELKKWLYENQGEARFDASNRFFLILTDESEIYNSWKLKRNINFLREHINKHLDNISSRTEDLHLDFYWKKDKQTYSCKSDILFLKYKG